MPSIVQTPSLAQERQTCLPAPFTGSEEFWVPDYNLQQSLLQLKDNKVFWALWHIGISFHSSQNYGTLLMPLMSRLFSCPFQGLSDTTAHQAPSSLMGSEGRKQPFILHLLPKCTTQKCWGAVNDTRGTTIWEEGSDIA